MALTRPLFGREQRPALGLRARLRRSDASAAPAAVTPAATDAVTCPRCAVQLSVAGPSDKPYWVCPLCEGVKTR